MRKAFISELAEVSGPPCAFIQKLATSDPMSRFQPSTSTNSISLNGSEISTGESIIMPMDMSTLATTMSMMRKGMKIMKPIWNAVFSSLVTNAGTTTFSGRSWDEATGRHVAELHEEGNVRLARLLEHEALERRLGLLQRFVEGKAVLAVWHVGVGVDFLQHRAHDEKGQEQRQPDHHLVGRRGLRADGLAQQRQHDDDAREGRPS